MADLWVGQFGGMADLQVGQIEEWSQKLTPRTNFRRVCSSIGRPITLRGAFGGVKLGLRGPAGARDSWKYRRNWVVGYNFFRTPILDQERKGQLFPGLHVVPAPRPDSTWRMKN